MVLTSKLLLALYTPRDDYLVLYISAFRLNVLCIVGKDWRQDSRVSRLRNNWIRFVYSLFFPRFLILAAILSPPQISLLFASLFGIYRCRYQACQFHSAICLCLSKLVWLWRICKRKNTVTVSNWYSLY